MDEMIIFRNPEAQFRAEAFGGIVKVGRNFFTINKKDFQIFLDLITPKEYAVLSEKIDNSQLLEYFLNNKLFIGIDRKEAQKIIEKVGKEVS